jgi:hypothetical protein
MRARVAASNTPRCADMDNVDTAKVSFDATAKYSTSIKWIHGVCFAFHLSAAMVILGYTYGSDTLPTPPKPYNRYVSASMFGVERWTMTCAGATVKGSCPDELMVFSETRPDKVAFTFNIFVCLVWFSTWSGVVHFVRWLVVCGYCARTKEPTEWSWRLLFDPTWKGEVFARLAVDYTCSASVMLACFSALYGALNLFSLVLAPILLVVLLVLSAALLLHADKLSAGTCVACFVALLAAYGLVLVRGVLYAVAELTTEIPGDEPAAPSNVLWIASLSTVAFFSSFVVPYTFELRWMHQWSSNASTDADHRDKNERRKLKYSYAYAFLSLVAKVFLHLTFTVVAGTQSAGLTSPDPPDFDAQQNNLYRIMFAVPTTGVFVFALLWGLLHAYFTHRLWRGVAIACIAVLVTAVPAAVVMHNNA